MSSEPSFGEHDYLSRRIELGLLPVWLAPVAPFLDTYLSIFVHLGIYALLALLITRAAYQSGRLSRRARTIGWLTAVLYGVSDEWHQSFVPGRNPSWEDLIVNAVGALAGILVWTLWRKARRATQPSSGVSTHRATPHRTA